MKVKSSKAGASGRTTSVTKAKAPEAQKKVAPKKADKFGGSTKAKADKPAAQLPRSGWSSVAEFKKAQTASRALAGLQAGGLQDRPVIRPLYGIVFPLPIDPSLKDHHLEAAAKAALGDKKITMVEVNNLMSIAKSNGTLSKTEKKDLKRLMDNAGQFFDIDALRTLQAFVKDAKPVPDPVIRPLYGMQMPIPLPEGLRNKDLKEALKPMLGDRKISVDEVNTLIKLANDNGGLSKTERADLEKVYDQAPNFLEPDAHFKLGQAIGREPVIRPLYGIVFPVPMTPDLKDKSLKAAAKEILGDRRISSAEVDTLIKAASDNKGLSKTERTDLNRLLTEVGDKFDADAKAKLQAFLKEGSDGLAITHARRDLILGKLDGNESKMHWTSGFPVGTRMVEVPLKNGHTDQYSFTALIPVGAMSPITPS